jgi:hypothetical protein
MQSSNNLTLYDPSLSKSKWNMRSPTVDKSVTSPMMGAHGRSGSWAARHMYRTSYTDMSNKVSFYKSPN